MNWRSVPVLCFHGVAPSGSSHDLATFERILDMLARLRVRTIGASALHAICVGRQPVPPRTVALTFDDGTWGHWAHAAPALARHGMVGTFFIVTDWLGEGPPRGAREAPPPVSGQQAFRLAAVARDYQHFLRRSEARALVDDLGMEVHSHSAAHRPCFRSLLGRGTLGTAADWRAHAIYGLASADLPVFTCGSAYAWNGYEPVADGGRVRILRRSDTARTRFCVEDFRRSLDAVREINGSGTQFLCWPWGAHDDLAVGAAREVGFTGAFCLERGTNAPGTDPFRMNRLRVRPGRGPAWLLPRLLIYGTRVGARISRRRFRKAPEVARVVLASSARELSGGARQVLSRARGLAASGVAVTIAAPAGSGLIEAAHGFHLETATWEAAGPLVRAARELAALARAGGADVVHAHHPRAVKAAVLARLLGLRARVVLNRGVLSPPNALWGVFAAITGGAVANSAAAAATLRARLAPGTRVHVVYNSCEPAAPGEAPEKAGPGPLMVAWVGNAHPGKGLDVFGRVATQLERTLGAAALRAVAVGVDARTRPGLASGADGHLELPGRLAPAGVRRVLAGADVFVLTSFRESLPNVVLEAFAASLPVVATRVGGLAELVRDGVNGYLCPAGDADAIAARVRALAADPDARARMGDLNRRLVAERLDPATRALALLRVYCGDHVVEEPPVSWVERAAAGPVTSGAAATP